jgi:hypothetical protein
MLQWKEIDNQAFGVNSSLQQQQQLHVRGICVLAACNPEGPDLHWGPNNNQNQSGGSRSSSHRETHRDRERERERILQWGSFLWVVLEGGGLCAGGGGGRLSVNVQ